MTYSTSALIYRTDPDIATIQLSKRGSYMWVTKNNPLLSISIDAHIKTKAVLLIGPPRKKCHGLSISQIVRSRHCERRLKFVFHFHKLTLYSEVVNNRSYLPQVIGNRAKHYFSPKSFKHLPLTKNSDESLLTISHQEYRMSWDAMIVIGMKRLHPMNVTY